MLLQCVLQRVVQTMLQRVLQCVLQCVLQDGQEIRCVLQQYAMRCVLQQHAEMEADVLFQCVSHEQIQRDLITYAFLNTSLCLTIPPSLSVSRFLCLFRSVLSSLCHPLCVSLSFVACVCVRVCVRVHVCVCVRVRVCVRVNVCILFFSFFLLSQILVKVSKMSQGISLLVTKFPVVINALVPSATHEGVIPRVKK